MKKTTLLSLFTAGAIVATTAGTYAAWDVLEVAVSKEITVENTKVTVTAEQFGEVTTTNVLDEENITYEGNVTFNVSDISKINKLTLTPTVTAKDSSDINNKYTVELLQEGDSGITNANGVYTDSTISTTNSYKVKVIVTDEALVGKTLEVKVDAQGYAS